MTASSATVTHLKRSGVSVIIDTSFGTPNVLHWGREISEGNFEDFVTAQLETTPHCDFDDPELIGIWRENARGFQGAPAIQGSSSGQHWSQKFDLIETKFDTEHKATFVSEDSNAGLIVSASFELTESGILKIEQSIANTATESFQLDALTSFLPVPDYVAES